ncbi:unnamed protein product [Penicillium glandicola]
MEIFSIFAAVLSLTRTLGQLVNLCNDYRLLLATKELSYLLTKAEALRTILTCTASAFANIPRHSNCSFEEAGGYKALCEEFQRQFVDFTQTAKTINNEIQRVCGTRGLKLSKNRHLVQILWLLFNSKLFRLLQDRLSFHISSIETLLLALNIQKNLHVKLDQILTGQSRPDEVRAQQVDSAISFPNKHEPFTIPRLANNFYQGQKNYLTDLLQKLNPSSAEGSASQRQVICLHGDAGVGKTYLCSKFAEKHRTSYTVIVWIHVKHDQMTQFNVDITGSESLGSASTITEPVEWLASIQKSWLLIIDKDKVSTHPQKFYPSGDKGHIIVTATSSGFHTPSGFHPADCIHIPKMDTEDTQEFLLWAAGFVKPWSVSDRAWTQDVISRLGPKVLPLTLAHVGATIRNGFSTPEVYLAIFEKQSAMEPKTDPSEYSAILAFEVAVAQIQKQQTQSSKDAFKLLKIFPFFTTRYITLDSLEKPIFLCNTLSGVQQWSYCDNHDQSNMWAGSWREIKVSRCDFMRPNGKVKNTPQSPSNPESSESLGRSQAHWALMELIEMSLIIHRQSNDTYSMEHVIQKWIKDRLPQSEHDVWQKFANMVTPCNTIQPNYLEKITSTPLSRQS